MDDFETPVAAPRSFPEKPLLPQTEAPIETSTGTPASRQTRKRRSVVVSDRKARSADVGVSSIYEVISEADLAFSPDSKAEAVTVFQGKIREEVVYGICMPVPGFSILFIMVALSAVVSALVAGSLLYRYQLQRERIVEQQAHQNGTVVMSNFVNWVGVRFLKTRNTNKTSTSNGSIDGSIVYEKKTNGKTEE